MNDAHRKTYPLRKIKKNASKLSHDSQIAVTFSRYERRGLRHGDFEHLRVTWHDAAETTLETVRLLWESGKKS